jgi:hypothetical protein
MNAPPPNIKVIESVVEEESTHVVVGGYGSY